MRLILILSILIMIVLANGCIKEEMAETAEEAEDAVEEAKTGLEEAMLCVDEETGASMSLAEAKEIAMNSECSQGNITGEQFCNEYTGTWWLDLDIEREGCYPSCVVDVNTKTAEINWRCTGLITE